MYIHVCVCACLPVCKSVYVCASVCVCMLSFYLHVHGGKNVFVSVWLCGTGCVFLYVCKDSFFLLSFIFGVRGEKMCLCLGVCV